MSATQKSSFLPARNRVAFVLGGAMAIVLAGNISPVSAKTSDDGGASLWDSAHRPSQTCRSGAKGIELGTTFTPTVNGVVSELGYFKTSLNPGRSSARLYKADGTLVAEAVHNPRVMSGWHYTALSEPVPVRRGESYIVSYTSSTGCFAATKSYLARSRASSHLTVPVNGGLSRLHGQARIATDGTSFWSDVAFRPNGTSEAPQPIPKDRSKYDWPFSPDSIWNMPIGSGARYKPLNMTPPTTGYGTDEVYISFDARAPLRRLVDRGYWWPWHDGSQARGAETGVNVRVPDNWIIGPPLPGSYPNRSAVALQDDGRAREFQYVVRPSAGSDLSIFEGVRATYDLAGDGLTGRNGFGAHGGSGMTAIGGTIRKGELTSPEPIRHALALTVNMRKWGSRDNGGYHWPAIAADLGFDKTAHATGYGTLGAQSGPGLGMGSLLALPASVDIDQLRLETHEGRKLAWTYQNYGAYVVDDSVDPGDFDVFRHNVEISVLDEYPAVDTGFTTDTAFGRDMNKIVRHLALVANNGPTSVGGGGDPLQPLAPPIRD